MEDQSIPALFHKVILLNEEKDLSWEALVKEVPHLPRGWFELSRFPIHDRIEFTRDFWCSKLPFASHKGGFFEERIAHFFAHLENIEIFLTQETATSPFDVHMIYSLKDGEGYFHGYPPAAKEQIQHFAQAFKTVQFAPDYLAFFEIHDGFSKYMDTGLLRLRELAKTYQKFQQLFENDLLVTPEGGTVNPVDLIPFYESGTLHCYQCFYADWTPEEEMGNFSFCPLTDRHLPFYIPTFIKEGRAFATFLEWLTLYLEEAYVSD